MKTTLADKIAVACVLGTALLTGISVVYATAAERNYDAVKRVCAPPLPEFNAAIRAADGSSSNLALANKAN